MSAFDHPAAFDAPSLAVGRALCWGIVAALVFASHPATADGRSLGGADVERFLEGLEGAWQGQAEITPIGPRPYDISFAHKPDGALEGSAEPGAATHTWTFGKAQDGLTLHFLSTFRGNRRPILLAAGEEREGMIVFRATTPDFLQVRVRVEPRSLLMRVLHGERLHVEIRLRR